jgi:hypothetical protein
MLSRKNGLLFVAGGLASIAIVSLLEAAEDEHYDMDKLEADNTDAAFQKLVDEVRKDAKWAMDECRNDDDREKVYGQVKEAMQRFQAKLQSSGEEIIEELRSQITEDINDDEELNARINSFVSKVDRVTDTLNQTLEDMKTTATP